MKLSDRLKKDAQGIWQEIVDHPFVTELFEGTLPEDKFRHYVLQDYGYLIASIRNFSVLASRAGNERDMRELVEIAALEAGGEFDGYRALLKEMGLTLEEAEAQQPGQAAVSYTGFLLSTSMLGAFEEGITAVLPCYWSYAEMAAHHRKKIARNKRELYRRWAGFYLEDGYLSLVERIKKLVDEAGAGFPYPRLRRVFLTSSRYEVMFWDSVYHGENTTT